MGSRSTVRNNSGINTTKKPHQTPRKEESKKSNNYVPSKRYNDKPVIKSNNDGKKPDSTSLISFCNKQSDAFFDVIEDTIQNILIPYAHKPNGINVFATNSGIVFRRIDAVKKKYTGLVSSTLEILDEVNGTNSHIIVFFSINVKSGIKSLLIVNGFSHDIMFSCIGVNALESMSPYLGTILKKNLDFVVSSKERVNKNIQTKGDK